MIRIPIFQVDAFASEVFRGNPAAVCPLQRWLPDALLQSIAMENALSETAFLVAEGDDWRLRWFTPVNEVDLCGHATLATAWVVFNRLAPQRQSVVFHTRSGPLPVARRGALIELDFPSWPPRACPPEPALVPALGAQPLQILAARDWLCVFADEAAVKALQPDMGRLAALERLGVIVTAPAAPGRGVDFVSRFFAPAEGVPEDPVTGSAHSMLVPYWAARLGRESLLAEQVSARGGRLECRLQGGRVLIAGRCASFLMGEIEIPG